MLNPDNATLEWCAKWIEDSLRAETDERTIEFGRNMAMTIRAVKTKDAAPPPTPSDAAMRAATRCVAEIRELVGTANDGSPAGYIVFPFQKTVDLILKYFAVTPSSDANVAATEICDYCGVDTNDAERVVEIIIRNCFPAAGVGAGTPQILVEAQWIIDHHHNLRDGGCVECMAPADIGSDFVCVYHRAAAALRNQGEGK